MRGRVWDLFPPSQTDLFNAFDELATLHVASDIHGPQLIVVGDQNSGKSSVLEAIIREPFPVMDGLCTRFPIKLLYHRSATERYQVRIEPGRSRREDERQELLGYCVSGSGSDTLDFGKQVHDAGIALGIKQDAAAPAAAGYVGVQQGASRQQGTSRQQAAKEFCDDVLVIEKHGPNLPRVNLLDLPGLFASETTVQGGEGMETVRRMVKEYIGSRRSIVLLIISARNQYATQISPSVVTEVLAGDSRLAGRLVGVVTNPDHPGLDQDEITSLLRGDLSRLQPNGGWYVVRNDDKAQRHWRKTMDERDAREAQFFQQDSFWQKVPGDQKGIERLMGALRGLIQNHIRSELPGIVREVESKAAVVDNRIRHAYGSRATPELRQKYLKVRARKFVHWTKEATDGLYRDLECEEVHDVGQACPDCQGFFSPFGDNPPEGQDKRLRSNIRVLNRAFAATMRRFGKTDTILDGTGTAAADTASTAGRTDGPSTQMALQTAHIPMADAFPHYQELFVRYYSFPEPHRVTRADHEAMVAKEIERWRALEPSEEASPAACWGLLDYQSRLWKEIATNHLLAVWEITGKFIDLALAAAFSDSEVLWLLREHLVDKNLTKLRQSSQTILKDLLQCRRGGNTGFYDGFSDNSTFLHSQMGERERHSSPSTSRDTAPSSPGQGQGPLDGLAASISDAVGELPTTLAGVGNAIGGPILGVAGGILDHALTSATAGGDPDGGNTGAVTPARIINQVELYYEVSLARRRCCFIYMVAVANLGTLCGRPAWPRS